MTADTDDVPVVDRLVYIGRRMDATKTYHAYLPLAIVDVAAGDLGARYYAKPLNDFASVGQVVEVVRAADGRSVVMDGEHRPRIVAPEDLRPSEWPTDEQVAGWVAADRAAYVIAQTIKTDRRLAREAPDPLHAALDVVRAAYRAQRGIASRAAFVRYVEEYVHS